MNRLVITGGLGGLGAALAKAFSDSLWEILTPGREELDVTLPHAVASYFQERPVDLLVCAAGTIRDAPLARLGEAAWDEVMAVNYEGSVACAFAVLPEMIRRGTGHIVFISSFSALHPPAGQAAYATAKAALLGLTKTLATAHGAAGIRVNCVLPGFLETNMTARLTGARKHQVRAHHALGRFNTTTAVGKFIRYLEEDLPHTSGQVFQLDSRIS